MPIAMRRMLQDRLPQLWRCCCLGGGCGFPDDGEIE
jgi:hypothetical protein